MMMLAAESAAFISAFNSLNGLVLKLFGPNAAKAGEPLQVRWIEATFPWTSAIILATRGSCWGWYGFVAVSVPVGSSMMMLAAERSTAATRSIGVTTPSFTRWKAATSSTRTRAASNASQVFGDNLGDARVVLGLVRVCGGFGSGRVVDDDVGPNAAKAGEPLQVRWIEATFPWTAPSYEVEVLFNGKRQLVSEKASCCRGLDERVMQICHQLT
jgi:hypothetical protein